MPHTELKTTPTISVALGVVLRDNRILVGWRDSALPLGGCWEFPGGKVKLNEAPKQAVVRELKEELGLVIKESDAEPLIEFKWLYDAQRYSFSVYKIKNCRGEPSCHFYKSLEWQTVSELKASDFPPANRVIIKALSLPDRYLITPSLLDLNVLKQGLDIAFQSGISLAVFRSTEIDSRTYIEYARKLLSQSPTWSSRLLIHNHPTQVDILNAAGVQLSAKYATKYRTRPLAEDKLLAVSCHNRIELEHACRLEADFALLGPLKATPSHPGESSLGWEAFRTLVTDATIPVYAIGGLKTADLADCRTHGAQGIAAIRNLWPLS